MTDNISALHRFLILGVIGLISFSSCSIDSFEESMDMEPAVLIARTSPHTKTQISKNQPGGYLEISWSPADCIGVFTDKSSHHKFVNTLKEESEHALFSGEIQSGSSMAYAYYPYNPSATDPSEVPVVIGTQQQYLDGQSIGAYDIKASNCPDPSDEGTLFVFQSMSTLLKITFSDGGYAGLGQDEMFDKVIITNTADRPLTGQFKLDLSDLSLTADPAENSSSVSVASDGTSKMTEDDIVLYASIFQGVKNGDRLKFAIHSSSRIYSFYMKASKDFVAGCCYDIEIDLNKASKSKNFTAEDKEILPTFTSFCFKAAHNPKAILDKEVYFDTKTSTTKVRDSEGASLTIDEKGNVSGCIPYLYNYSLVPEFSLSNSDECYEVRVNGDKQTSGTSVQDFTETVKYTIINTQTGASADYSVSVFNTGLPVVVLTQNTAGTSYVNNWNYYLDRYIPSKTSDFGTTDRIAIYDGKGGTLTPEMNCGFRHRGNFSMRFPKKAMNIKLSEKTKILGMGKHKRWVLLANYNDRTVMRNCLSFEIARRVAATSADGTGLDWQPSGKYVELVFNGMHVGNYYLCEQIRQDKNRIAISDSYEDRRDDYNSGKSTEEPSYSNCGYLLEMDNNTFDATTEYGYEEWKFRTSYCYERSNSHIPVVSQNDYDNTTTGQSIWNQIKSYVNTADYYVNKGNYSNAASYIDMVSAADYMLVMEMTMNHEYMHPKSVFLHKDGEGKLFFGPVWDFDVWTYPVIPNISTMGKQNESYPNSYGSWTFTTESTSHYYIWYRHLLKTTDFVNLVKERWAAISASAQLSPEAVGQYIQSIADEISLSMKYNDQIWPRTYSSPNFGYQNGDEWKSSSDHTPYTFEEAVELIKSTYQTRYSKMSTMVSSLSTKTINR